MQNFSENYTAARALVLQQKHGVLATLSQTVAGYPFGSVTPYALDRQGNVIILISNIAEHTKNIQTDHRVSLTILAHDEPDVQAKGRVTLLADARPISLDALESQERYYRYFPESRDYHKAHDFAFYLLDLVRIRYIGGFGRIYWLEPEDFTVDNPFSQKEEARILDHMNGDHQAAMRHYFQAFKKMAVGEDQAIEMVGIDSEGFDLRAQEKLVRFEFDRRVETLDQARQALVEMGKS